MSLKPVHAGTVTAEGFGSLIVGGLVKKTGGAVWIESGGEVFVAADFPITGTYQIVGLYGRSVSKHTIAADVRESAKELFTKTRGNENGSQQKRRFVRGSQARNHGGNVGRAK